MKLEEEMLLDSWYKSKYSVVHLMQVQEECHREQVKDAVSRMRSDAGRHV